MLFIAVLIKLRLPSNGIWVAYWSCFILEAAQNCAWLQCCVHFYLLVLVPGTCCCAGAGTHMPAFHFWHQLLSHFAYCGGNMTLLGNLCTNVQLLATRTFKGCSIGSPCQRDLPTCIEFKKQKMYNFAPWLNTREMVGHKCACVCAYGDYCSQAWLENCFSFQWCTRSHPESRLEEPGATILSSFSVTLTCLSCLTLMETSDRKLVVIYLSSRVYNGIPNLCSLVDEQYCYWR